MRDGDGGEGIGKWDRIGGWTGVGGGCNGYPLRGGKGLSR
jgi:hypothetical protein